MSKNDELCWRKLIPSIQKPSEKAKRVKKFGILSYLRYNSYMKKIILLVITIISYLYSIDIFATPVQFKLNSDGSTTIISDWWVYWFANGTKITKEQTADMVWCSTGWNCSMFPPSTTATTVESTTNLTTVWTSANPQSTIPKTFNYSDTKGNSATIDANWKWAIQNWVWDPISFSARESAPGRYDITTTDGITTCDAGLCVWPNAADFQTIIDSYDNFQNSQGWSSSSSPSWSAPKNTSTDNILWIPADDLRNGNITMEDIPLMIASAIEYLLAIAGTICVVALIYHAVRMQFASGITGDSTGVDKAKKWIYGSVLGFILSMSAWFIMTRLVALLASTTWW